MAYFTAREFMGLTQERMNWEEVQRQSAMHRICRNANIFKVFMKTNQYLKKLNRYTKI